MKALLAALLLIGILIGCGQEEDSGAPGGLTLPALY